MQTAQGLFDALIASDQLDACGNTVVLASQVNALAVLGYFGHVALIVYVLRQGTPIRAISRMISFSLSRTHSALIAPT